MKINFRTAAVALGAAGAAFASADPSALQDIIRDGFVSGMFGAYLLGETLPTDASTTSPTRDAGSYVVSPNVQTLFDGTNQFYFAGVSDGFLDTASGSGVNGKQDVLGFSVNFDPSNYGVIDVVRTRIANAQGTATNSVNQFGIGSVANDGTIALKMTIGTGNSNGFGTISATNTSLVAFGAAGTSTTSINEYTPSSGTGYSLLGASGTATFNVPSIGSYNGVVLNANFSKQVTASKSTYTGGSYLATTKVLATIAAGATDNRGSITYNDQAGLAAVLRTKQTATVGTTAINHVTAVAVYKVTFDASGNPQLRDLAGNLSTLGTEVALPKAVATVNGKSLDLVGTNYFSRSAFVGPVQIAMNDNGDIALTTVAVDVTATNDTGQNQERGSSADHRIIVAKYNAGSSAYGSWVTAAQSGQGAATTDGSGNLVANPGTGDFVAVNPVSTQNTIGTGNPALDDEGNVYFAAPIQAELFAAGGSTVRVAIFRAPRAGSVYSPVERVLQEGDVIEDPNDLTDRTVTFIPLTTASSDLTNANIRYPAGNSFNPNSALHDIAGGLTLACRLTDGSGDPASKTRWNFLFLPYR